MKKLTQKRLKEVLHYDPNTGIFTRKITTAPNAIKGSIAGYNPQNDYSMISVDGKQYLTHLLAWLYIYGYFPENDIDHKDKIKHHNWINNLREVSRQCNMRNCGNRITNTSGVKGVYKTKRKLNIWKATIMVNYKYKSLGVYQNFDDAVCARLAGEQCIEWDGCDSCSPAYQYVQKMLKKKNYQK